MQELSQAQVIKPPSQFPWFASLGLLALTILASAGLWGYGYMQSDTIARTESQIQTLDTDIANASKDKKIYIANILESTQIRPSIDLKKLVSTFREVATTHQVRLQGFSVQKDTISSSLTALSNSTDAVENIIRMMRAKSVASGVILEPIYTVQ